MIQKRADAGDPTAICHLGQQYQDGELGLDKDVTRAVELYERAAELELKHAHYELGVLYYEGTKVEKDTAKAIRHYEEAATGGHVFARCNLGCVEDDAGNDDLALRHYLIAANLGDKDALVNVKDMLIDGLGTKPDYAEALLGYQRAIGEMRSDNRDEAQRIGI